MPPLFSFLVINSRLNCRMALTFILIVTGVQSCEQYNPTNQRQQFNQERLNTLSPLPSLAAGGNIPETGAVDAPPLSVEEQQFASFCASCHGGDGQANTPAILAMNPVPRNLTDPAWHNAVDDAHIAKVIKLGGQAVGLSVTMAPWGAVLSNEDIDRLVKLIRSWQAEAN